MAFQLESTVQRKELNPFTLELLNSCLHVQYAKTYGSLLGGVLGVRGPSRRKRPLCTQIFGGPSWTSSRLTDSGSGPAKPKEVDYGVES